jgi:hypothetical protein
MRFIFRGWLVAFMAVVVMSVMGSATASAAGCTVRKESKKYGLCVAGVATETAPAEWETLHEEGKKYSWLMGGWMKLPGEKENPGPIYCEQVFDKNASVEFRGSPTESTQLNQGQVEMRGCKITGKIGEKCSMDPTKGWESTLAKFGASIDALTVENAASGPEGTLYDLVPEGSNCPALYKGEHALKGSYECQLHEPEVENVKHIEVCEGSKLKFDGYPSELKYEAWISLRGADAGKKFRFYER